MNLTWIEISKRAIANNLAQIKKNIPQTAHIGAVIKANAAGHGMLKMASEIADKVDYMCVYSFEDAKRLRQSKIKNHILLLGRIFPFQLQYALDHEVEVTVSTLDVLEAIKALNGKKPKIHICVDSGLGRDGFLEKDLDRVLAFIKESNVDVRGLYTHLSSADETRYDDYTKQQIKILFKWKKALHDIGYSPIVHLGGSSGIFHQELEEKFDMLRVGNNLFGLWTSRELFEKYGDRLKIEPILSWKTRIIEMKDLPKGSSISYGRTHQLARDSKIAIVPIGYYDGIFRTTSNQGQFLVNGTKVKQVGRVTMNMTILDVTDAGNVNVGDVVTIIGQDGNEKIMVEDWAKLANTSNYEIVTRLNAKIKRILVP